ncbi:MAG: flavin reductase [Clostridiales bacterium]|nr:MAG: flavin reductase [Clostridiales bacterium]
MAFQKIDPKTFHDNVFTRIGSDWFLLTAGNEDCCNTMTAAWGGLGFLWNKNVATVYVRKSRHTFGFMEENDIFTMSFFDPSHRDVLNYCGSKLGRDVDKIKECGLTKIMLDGGVAFEEADLVIVCKKLHHQELAPEYFTNASVEEIYAADPDYHTMYIGEILGMYRK